MNFVLGNVVSGVLVVAICNLFKIIYQWLKAKMRQRKERRPKPKDRRS